MNKIINASEKERRAIFLESSKIKGISAAMVEKDFWVTWVLSKIFNDEFLKKSLCFKGGTSLSKVFHLIERFSEDIDLILDWRLVTIEDVFQKTKSKQEKFNEKLCRDTCNFIATSLKDKIQHCIMPTCEVSVDKNDGNTLNIAFPKSILDDYIKPFIKLEIGPLAAWKPNEVFPITSYVAEANPSLKIEDVFVPTIRAERTFWEKATILHREHFRPSTTSTPIRYSRHYYDLYKMANSSVKDFAFENFELLKSVVDFKKKFYPCNWAKYDSSTMGEMHLIPSNANLIILQKDYEAMHSMIFGDYPPFSAIINSLQTLEAEINNLNK